MRDDLAGAEVTLNINHFIFLVSAFVFNGSLYTKYMYIFFYFA